ncbi:hypothetical protein ACHAWO_004201 [Cyclotella atomus]|jgi:hypothetical protein|uniref:Uncharacterized protein n=1 Tax=Cyclotella atomus TaxID=382360 RepID=A0ABD3NAM9_9STRA
MANCRFTITLLLLTAAIYNTEGFTPTPLTRTHATTNTRLSAFGTSKSRITKNNSPLLEEALSAYPYKFKSDSDKFEKSQTFNEMARLYGDKEALEMVKICPQTLKFKRENFQRCLDSWEDQFGLEKAQGMVLRNPGLLGIRPEQTDGAESSMVFSYIVALTRPLPKIVAVVGLLAILTAGMR